MPRTGELPVYRILIILITILSLSFSQSLSIRLNDFTGGINTKTSPEKLKINQATDITNMNFDTQGSIKTRSGVTVNYIPTGDFITSYFVNTSNGDIRSVHLGNVWVDGRNYDSLDYNGSLAYYGYDSHDWYFFPIISFEGFINKIKNKKYSKVMWVGSPVGVAPATRFYLVSSNVNMDTVTYNSLDYSTIDRDGISVNFSYVGDLGTGRFMCDMTSMIDRMIETGYYCMTTGTINTNGDTKLIPIDFGSAYGSYLVVSFDNTLININDKENNALIYSDRVEYNGVTKDANLSHYANSLENIYFFGDENDYTYNKYSNSFTDIGYQTPTNINYSLVNVSGNLTGSFNYAVTNVYDNRFESNAYHTSSNAITKDYTNGIWFFRKDGFNYAIEETGGQVSIIETNTSNVLISSKILLNSSQPIFKVILYENSIYFSTMDGYIYSVDLDSFYVSSFYNQYPQFTIANGYIYTAGASPWPPVAIAQQFHSGGLSVYVQGGYGWYIYETTKRDLNFSKILESYGILFYPAPRDSGILFTQTARVGDLATYGNNAYVNFSLGGYGDSCYNYMSIISDGDAGGVYYPTLIPTVKLYYGEQVTGLIATSDAYFYSYGNYAKLSDPLTKVSCGLTHLSSSYANSSIVYSGFEYGKNQWDILSKDFTTIISTGNSYTGTINFAVNNQQILVTVPTANSSRVTARNIYRSWNDTGYYFLTKINDNITTNYNDNISILQQSVIPMEYDNDIPPDSIDSTYTSARMFYLDNNGTVWYSKINNPESVPALNYIPIRADSSDVPRRIISFYSGLLIFFDKSIWYIDLSNTVTLAWVPHKLNIDFGCSYPFSICLGKLPNQNIGLFYFSNDKSIRVLNGTTKQDIQLFDNIYTDKLSMPIEEDLKGVTDDYKDIYMTYYDYKLYLNIPSKKIVYVWDAQLNAFTKYSYINDFLFLGKVDSKLIAGEKNTATQYELENKDVSKDMGIDISWNYKTKVIGMEDYEVLKDYNYLWLRGKQFENGTISVNIYNNMDNYIKANTLNMSITGNSDIVTKKRLLNDTYGRDIQIEFKGNKNTRIDDATLLYTPRSD